MSEARLRDELRSYGGDRLDRQTSPDHAAAVDSYVGPNGSRGWIRASDLGENVTPLHVQSSLPCSAVKDAPRTVASGRRFRLRASREDGRADRLRSCDLLDPIQALS